MVDFAIAGLSEAEMETLNRGWHRLQPWRDVVTGLTRLKKKFIIAPLSNGNIALMTNLAKYSGLRLLGPSSSGTTNPTARSISRPRIFSI